MLGPPDRQPMRTSFSLTNAVDGDGAGELLAVGVVVGCDVGQDGRHEGVALAFIAGDDGGTLGPRTGLAPS